MVLTVLRGLLLMINGTLLFGVIAFGGRGSRLGRRCRFDARGGVLPEVALQHIIQPLMLVAHLARLLKKALGRHAKNSAGLVAP
jgi:hypothetical protein